MYFPSMAIFWRRVILVLILVISILQVIHMVLLSRLESKKNEVKQNRVFSNYDHFEQINYSEKELEQERKRMLGAYYESSVLDSSGEMHIINNFAQAKALSTKKNTPNDITLVTQTSLSGLHHLEHLVKRWHGLISVSLFSLASDIPLAIEMILSLRKCFPLIRHNTSFHLVYPLHIPSLVTSDFLITPKISLISSVSCDKLYSSIKSLYSTSINYVHDGFAYPNNLLRNVGRRNSYTEFVFVIDIDLVPNYRLDEDFMRFAKDNKLLEPDAKKDKVVYVVPAYEVKSSLDDNSIPSDKAVLLQMVEMMKCRPFYFEICWKCQKYTDYETWEKEPPTSKLGVLFEVLWRDPWEPFYISRNDVPNYDERFRQYGFNRISQVCELHVAGYKFSVLNNAFLIHKGLKTVGTFHQEKDLELEKNRHLFRQFKNELKTRYPDLSRRCN